MALKEKLDTYTDPLTGYMVMTSLYHQYVHLPKVHVCLHVCVLCECRKVYEQSCLSRFLSWCCLPSFFPPPWLTIPLTYLHTHTYIYIHTHKQETRFLLRQHMQALPLWL